MVNFVLYNMTRLLWSLKRQKKKKKRKKNTLNNLDCNTSMSDILILHRYLWKAVLSCVTVQRDVLHFPMI